MSGDTEATLVPATRYIHIAESGKAHIEGYRCGACGAAYLEPRMACARCAARGGFTTFEASTRGVVHTYSIVHRSFPGVKTPFISVIVDLSDGLVLKGNLEGVEPKPSKELFGMPVQVAFKTLDQKNASGVPYVTYFFEPA